MAEAPIGRSDHLPSIFCFDLQRAIRIALREGLLGESFRPLPELPEGG